MSKDTARELTIMFTDLVGYSSMMRADEQQAIELLNEHRQILGRVIESRAGTVIDYAGDAIFARFDDPVEAALAGLDIQRALQQHNQEHGRNLHCRIGLHRGKVQEKDGQLFGDNINIAARLEPLGDPGGVCISETVYRELDKGLQDYCVSYGNPLLKNIGDKLEVFHLFPFEVGSGKRLLLQFRKVKRYLHDHPKIRMPLGIASILFVAFLVMLPLLSENDSENVTGVYESIAVLPFVNMSDDPSQEYFSDGVSEEIINLLAKIGEIQVAARTSSFAFKEINKDIKTIAEELGVDTVLEGSVRKSGDELRITAQLIESNTGYHLWSETYNRKLADIFAIQGEIGAAIVEALQGQLAGKQLEVMTVRSTDVEAYNAYLKGRQLVDSEIKSKIYASLAEFDQAIQIAPNYAPAHSGKAEAYIQLSEYAYGDLPSEQAYTLAKPSLEKALSLDPDLADAHVVKGRIFTREGKYDEALMAFNQAIKIAPNHARAYFWRGTLQQAHGYRAKKMQDYEVSYRLNPLFTPVSHHLYHDYISENQLDKAYEILRRMREEYADQTDIGSQMKLAHYEVAWLLVNGDWSDAYQLAIKFVEESDNFLIADLGYILFFLKNEEAFYHYYNNKFFPINEFFVSYFFNNKEHADKALESLRNSSSSKKKEFLPIANALRLDMNNDDTSVIAANRLIKDVDESVNGILFKTYPPYTYASYIVAARLRAGDEAGVKRLTEQFRKFVEKYERNGYDCCIKYQQAYLKVLEQDYEGAMDLLEETFKNNSLYWHHIEHPILSPIHNNERYKSLVKVYSEFLNAERQKLGWAPVVIGYNQDVINN